MFFIGDNIDSPLDAQSKKTKGAYSLPDNTISAINLDKDNKKLWQDLMVNINNYKVKLFEILIF